MKNRSLKDKKILITCGPTWVPIDDTRVISNISSGELGQTLAQQLTHEGASVTVVEGPVAKRLESKSIKVLRYWYFDELQNILKSELRKKYAAVIHAAAVSDYKLKNPLKTKLVSKNKTLTLNLIATPKIIQSIKKINPNVFLVGFKLLSKLTEKDAKEQSKKLFSETKCDLIIANSLAQKKYKGFILNNNLQILTDANTRAAITNSLVQILKKSL